jgi:hypothetical protein
MGVNAIPVPLLERARVERLMEETIAKHWALFVDWHIRTHGAGADFRVRDWERQIAFARRDEEESVPTTSEALAAAKSADDRRRKAREDEAYMLAAMPFAAWCRDTLEQHRIGEPVTEHDLQIAEWAESRGFPSFGAWLTSTGFTV